MWGYRALSVGHGPTVSPSERSREVRQASRIAVVGNQFLGFNLHAELFFDPASPSNPWPAGISRSATLHPPSHLDVCIGSTDYSSYKWSTKEKSHNRSLFTETSQHCFTMYGLYCGGAGLHKLDRHVPVYPNPAQPETSGRDFEYPTTPYLTTPTGLRFSCH